MTKYTVEGDIDFYVELNKESNINVGSSAKECLITYEPLREKYIILKCGHSFNYEPLFYDIMNQKKKYNSMERHILRAREIRCPYCRNIQSGLLPYYEDLGIEKVHGVHFFDDSLIALSSVKTEGNKYSSYFGECSYIHENGDICKNTFVSLVETLGKPYCTYHKYKAIQEQIKKDKEAVKEAAKTEAKAIKEAAKAASKAAKEAAKAEATEFCKELIKTGKNAGKECSCKVFENGKCKRHIKKE